MGTSKSGEVPSPCVGTASVYSGRPDPVWHVSSDRAEALKRIWNELPPSKREPPPAPPLGYHGCALQCPSGEEWFAYGGVVTLKRGGRTKHRLDELRHFERALLDTAPDGALPEKLLD